MDTISYPCARIAAANASAAGCVENRETSTSYGPQSQQFVYGMSTRTSKIVVVSEGKEAIAAFMAAICGLMPFSWAAINFLFGGCRENGHIVTMHSLTLPVCVQV